MNQRIAFALAAALTAFVLVVSGVLADRFWQRADRAAPAAATATTTFEQTDVVAIQQRIAEYQAALAEANRRLERANQQLTDQGQPAEPTSTAVSYAVSSEQAQQIALNAAPGATLTKAAELVRYAGTPAYEVVLDGGTLYIDAQSGAILANGTTVGSSQAAEIAVAYLGGGTVRSVEQQQGQGATIFVVTFSDGAVVTVDAASGQVVSAQLRGHEEREHDEGPEHDGRLTMDD